MIREPLTYCSFVGGSRSGVVVLEGELGAVQACVRAHELGLSPGGEMLIVIVPLDIEDRDYFRLVENKNRFLSQAEARELLDAKSVSEWEEVS